MWFWFMLKAGMPGLGGPLCRISKRDPRGNLVLVLCFRICLLILFRPFVASVALVALFCLQVQKCRTIAAVPAQSFVPQTLGITAVALLSLTFQYHKTFPPSSPLCFTFQ